MPPHALKKVGYWLLDLFLPPQCVRCAKVETWLCESCAESLPTIDSPICSRCGDFVDSPGICKRCKTEPLAVNPIRAVYGFEDEIRDAIHALKYRGAFPLSPVLGSQMAAYWRYCKLETDLFIPVPLHPKRLAQRGYNQSWLLARDTGAALNIPVNPHALQRSRNTASQTQLSQAERMENVKGAFTCVEPAQVTGKNITLIDDVATTGSTLNACAVELLDKGARQVNALTLARAIK